MTVPQTETGTDTVSFPETGQVVNGFEALEIRDYPMINASVVRFMHQKTGAELYYIANDDINRVFDLTFRTKAPDDTGVPHVFEHAILKGSEKYPSTQLFFNLEYQTYNTYMNAYTYNRYTTYPVASMSEAQLLKLADYYTDSCFHPMILEDESIFRTEAWRYRLNDSEDPLTIEGTVFSEMLGKRSVEWNSYLYSLGAMFPGTTVGNEFCGDPYHIPEMTWQALKDYCANRNSDDGGIYIFTYEDPNIAETFEFIRSLQEMLREEEIDQETLKGYILQSYSLFAKPKGALSSAIDAAEAVLQGKPQDEALTWMRQIKQCTPERLTEWADMLQKLTEEGTSLTAGGAVAVNAEADRYDQILDSFGAEDRK